MTAVLVYWWAIGTFLRKLPGGFLELYRCEVRIHRNALLIARQLEDGWTPEALAMAVCADEGEGFGSARYEELLDGALWIQKRFKVKQQLEG